MHTLRITTFLTLCIIGSASYASEAEFPGYPGIKENVSFWKLVYATYTSRQLVFHDNQRLMRIYGVRTLPPGVNPYTRKAERISEAEKRKYRAVLLKFARGEAAKSQLENEVFKLFPPGSTAQDFRAAARNIRTQLGQANRFREGVIRSGLYMQHIQKVFREYQLPGELAYLPHVESSFDYRAYSKFGAAGIWQFIRSTGRRYMKVGYTIDERRDPIRSTVAAAKLLKSNYQSIRSWPLAITAYNHGLAGMQRAVRRLGTNDYMTVFYNHDGRRFGFASRNFYPSFLAAVEVASNHQKYFGPLKLMAPLTYEEYRMPRSISINTLVDHLGLDKQTFRSFNLGFRPAAYRYGKRIPRGYIVRLPNDPNVDYQSLMASLPTSDPKRFQQKDLEWVQVQQGDTLWELSQQLGVAIHELRALNDLDSNRILAGQILKVPQAAIKSASRTKRTRQVATKEPQQPVKLVSLPVSPERRDKASVLAKHWQAMVQTDEGATTKSHGIWHGPLPPRSWHGSLAVKDLRGEGRGKTGIVLLEAEETLGHFAEWLDVPTQRIRDLNRFSFDRSIRLGERIRIPLADMTVKDFEERRMQFHLSMQEDFHANYRVEGLSEYVVRRGDSIWHLCKNVFDIPMWLVREYNPNVDLANLQPGVALTYPSVTPLKS